MNHVTSTLAQSHWVPVAIFLATYILIAVESGRGSHLDRTAAAFCGAVAMVLVGAVPLDEAYKAIDWNTLIFLLGIMILVAHFQMAGFFDWIAVHVAAIGAHAISAAGAAGVHLGNSVGIFRERYDLPDLHAHRSGGHRTAGSSAGAIPDRGGDVGEYRVGDVGNGQSAERVGRRLRAFFISGISGASGARCAGRDW